MIIHPLIYGNWVDKNYFAFRFYDGDNDGIISSIDLADMTKNLTDKCSKIHSKKILVRQCNCILF